MGEEKQAPLLVPALFLWASNINTIRASYCNIESIRAQLSSANDNINAYQLCMKTKSNFTGLTDFFVSATLNLLPTPYTGNQLVLWRWK